jgi:hypothetical protein
LIFNPFGGKYVYHRPLAAKNVDHFMVFISVYVALHDIYKICFKNTTICKINFEIEEID